MFPGINQQGDICAHSVISDDLDVASGAEIDPSRSLDLHERFFHRVLEIFVCLEFALDQFSDSAFGTIAYFGLAELRKKSVVEIGTCTIKISVALSCVISFGIALGKVFKVIFQCLFAHDRIQIPHAVGQRGGFQFGWTSSGF